MESSLFAEFTKKLLAGTDVYPFVEFDSLERLPGGVVSLVLAATTSEPLRQDVPCNIVLKHTLEYVEDTPLGDDFSFPDRPSLLMPAPLTHRLDFRVLDLLQGSNKVKVPTLLRYYEDRRTTVMVDFRAQGFRLMQQMLVEGHLPSTSANSIGRSLANLVQTFGEFDGLIPAVEDSTTQCRERLDELHMFLRPQLPLYREIENRFLSGRHITPTDTHPKNMALDATGDVVFFDFGRSIVADEQYPAPNFAAHIALAGIGGCFDSSTRVTNYIVDFVEAYNKMAGKAYQIDELWFVRYFTAELLHRGLSGRWLDKRLFAKSRLQEVERAVHDFGIHVFRPEDHEPITSIEELLRCLQVMMHAVAEGGYSSKTRCSPAPQPR
jgi:hypothetical protein